VWEGVGRRRRRRVVARVREKTGDMIADLCLCLCLCLRWMADSVTFVGSEAGDAEYQAAVKRDARVTNRSYGEMKGNSRHL